MSEPVWTLGMMIDHGFDEEGRQRKERCDGVARCPVCREDVMLLSDTEVWEKDEETGRWLHESYGPSQRVCCDRLIVDYFDGCFVYDLRPQRKAKGR